MAGGFTFQADRDLLRSLQTRVRTLESYEGQPQPWAPTVSSSGTGFVVGAGSTTGVFIRRPGTIEAWFQITFTGTTFGTGSWVLRTPWATTANIVAAPTYVGTWSAIDLSSGARIGGFLEPNATGVGASHFDHWFYTAAGAAVTPTVPWTWVNGDSITGHLSYPIKPGY